MSQTDKQYIISFVHLILCRIASLGLLRCSTHHALPLICQQRFDRCGQHVTFHGPDLGNECADIACGQPIAQPLAPDQCVLIHHAMHPAVPQHMQCARAARHHEPVLVVPAAATEVCDKDKQIDIVYISCAVQTLQEWMKSASYISV